MKTRVVAWVLHPREAKELVIPEPKKCPSLRPREDTITDDVDRIRPRMISVAWRMLGSVADAEVE